MATNESNAQIFCESCQSKQGTVIVLAVDFNELGFQYRGPLIVSIKKSEWKYASEKLKQPFSHLANEVSSSSRRH
jgi:hypothetical protein